MICNFTALLQGAFFRWDRWNRWNSARFGAAMFHRHVAPVEPVLAGQVLPRSKSACMVPPVPPTGSTKITKTASSTTGSTWPRRSATALSRD